MRLLPLAFFASACALELVAILYMTDGSFVYCLDDPYIHLALAEGIARGHYGVNPGELGSPSSSLLWPILLAPFQRFAWGALVPLAVNLAAGVGSMVLLQRCAVQAVQPMTSSAELGVTIAVVSVSLCTNLIGLVFTGMEHSVQVLCVIALFSGLLREQAQGVVTGGSCLALLVAPWLRYECLAITIPLAVHWRLRGHRRVIAWAGGSIVGLLAFSAFLKLHGEALLPSSVLARTAPYSTTWLSAALEKLLDAARTAVEVPQAAVMCVVLSALLAGAVALPRVELRPLAVLFCSSILLHLLLGRFGAFSRYEAYIWTWAVLGFGWLCFDTLRGNLPSATGRRLAWVAGFTLFLCSARFVHKTVRTPWGARDIYRQQLQLHRFVVDYYRRPVAVNDLGWVAYRNEHYVLDLMGLASTQVRLARRDRADADWMAALARQHGVGLVMIYTHWFDSLPTHWIALGVLHMPEATSAASNEVAFFATSAEAARELRPLLRSFAAVLPEHVSFQRSEQGASSQ